MNTKPRAVLIGLDGVPYSLLLNLQSMGCIPNMARIFQDGCFGRMEVCVPEISSVSWTSFMTGKQPGEHGIFGFMDFAPGTYNLFFPNYTHLRIATLWDELARHGKQSVIINMPSTYPARSIHGAMISGFVAVDLDKAAFPPSLSSYLRSMGYRIDIDTAKARTDYDFLFKDLEETLDSRRRAAAYLWDEIDWDLFVVVVTGTDRLMHFLWEAYDDPSHPCHERFLDYFRNVDRFVGEIHERLMDVQNTSSQSNRFYMISDHGFTGIEYEVRLNAWLQENGFLKYRSTTPKSIMDIGPGTKAFALDPSRVYINLKGKYPLGCVDEKDAMTILHDLAQGLRELKTPDHVSVMKKVFTKEELYHGPETERAPDLVALSNHGFDLKGKVTEQAALGGSGFTGMHTQDDAFFFSSRGEACPSIFNAKRIISDCFQLPAHNAEGAAIDFL